MQRSAFTMLELVFVIVVMGILAAAIIPRMDRDTLYEASEQLLRDIRYTQHMAMMDNVYQDDVQNWFFERWKIDFSTANTYSISKGSAVGNFTDQNVTARDAQSKALIDGTEDYNFNEKFNVNITLPDANDRLFFDYLGRPYTANANPASAASNFLKQNYRITLTDSRGGTSTVTIQPETGYANIQYN